MNIKPNFIHTTSGPLTTAYYPRDQGAELNGGDGVILVGADDG